MSGALQISLLVAEKIQEGKKAFPDKSEYNKRNCIRAKKEEASNLKWAKLGPEATAGKPFIPTTAFVHLCPRSMKLP